MIPTRPKLYSLLIEEAAMRTAVTASVGYLPQACNITGPLRIF